MPLQPTDIPSRQGIQDAIDEAVEEHEDTSDSSGEHYDSEWQAVALTAGWGGTMEVRKIGHEVYLRGQIDNGPSSTTVPITGGSGTVIANLAAGFRPVGRSHVWLAVAQIPQTVTARMFANTSGTVSLYTYEAVTDYVSVMTNFLDS